LRKHSAGGESWQQGLELVHVEMTADVMLMAFFDFAALDGVTIATVGKTASPQKLWYLIFSW
jgi:hypothetical protein